MAKKKYNFYGVYEKDGEGKIFDNWVECAEYIRYKNVRQNGFYIKEEAEQFVKTGEKPSDASKKKTKKDHIKYPPRPNELVHWVSEPAETAMAEKSAEIEKTDTVKLDMSRILRGPLCRKVEQYCEDHGYQTLSEDQKRAVQADSGAYLLFAVPGSGKTTVLIARTGYLVHACGIPAKQIMTVTFTRDAAKEMRDRYEKRFPENKYGMPPDFRTIHGFCYSIVRKQLIYAGYICPNHVVNEEDREEREENKNANRRFNHRKIIADVLRRNGIHDCSDETVQDAFMTAFTGIKNRLMTREMYKGKTVSIKNEKYDLAPVYEDYQSTLHKLDCMDYDDMLLCALDGLKKYPTVLKKLRDTYRYWCVDEAQDNSLVQFELFNMLAGNDGNIFMVGDDDQSIYSFRGAASKMLLMYGNRSNVRLMVMNTNYRSSRNLVDAARTFVEKKNTERTDKKMVSASAETGEIHVPVSMNTETEQYAAILEAARQACEGNQLGVLYQLNISALPLLVLLHREGINFESSKGLSELIKGKVTGGIYRILRFCAHYSSIDALDSCAKNIGIWFINKERLDALKARHAENKTRPVLETLMEVMRYLKEKDEKAHDHLEQLRDCDTSLREIMKLKPAEAVRAIIEKGYVSVDSKNTNERLSLYALLSVCDLYGSICEMTDSLDAMMKEEKKKNKEKDISLTDEETEAVISGNKPYVALTTIHRAKGREWEHVILIDAFDKVFPGEPQPDRIGFDPEESARLFYVAITRAKNRLDIITVDKYHGNSEEASRFIREYAFLAETELEIAVTDPMPGITAEVRQSSVLQVGNTYNEAAEDAYQSEVMPKTEPVLKFNTIERNIHAAQGNVFNKPMDLPEEINRGIAKCFGASSLDEFAKNVLPGLKKPELTYKRAAATDYRGHTKEYMLQYLPVNFYKIWLPLWKLLKARKLPTTAKILELGPGPGTSTWSVLEMYRILAAENPETVFYLDYQLVEREAEFADEFRTLQSAIRDALPGNLKVKMHICKLDAYQYINSYQPNSVDLLLESNMVNPNEALNDQVIANLARGIARVVKPGGIVIMVEPGQMQIKTKLCMICKAADNIANCEAMCQPDLSSVNLDGILLLNAEYGTRYRTNPKVYGRNNEHWFSYMILEKRAG